MASLSELARLHTDLGPAPVAHLQRLVASWGVLADLCFADLLLHAPVDGDADRVVVLGHIRPTTSQTIYWTDPLGEVAPPGLHPVVSAALHTGVEVDGEVTHPGAQEPVQVLAVPVRHEGRVVAVLTRASLRSVARHRGELESTYLHVFARFTTMVAAGTFPFATELRRTETIPRVSDGVIVLDAAGRITFTSPNAVSALHRLGVHAPAVGSTPAELGLDDVVVRRATTDQHPVTSEVQQGTDLVLAMRCVPLLDVGVVSGALLLVRDVTELRRRDELLRSKDATIQEIHHRVKNNLQTISSLLRLQGRRLESPEAKAAVEESVRRIRTIALVHETLSREAADAVPFVEILRPLLRMVEEGLASPDRPVRFAVRGDLGRLPATVATPLAVVLTELFQNVVDHAHRSLPAPVAGHVVVELSSDDHGVRVRVVDDGVGVPADFSVDASTGLGLSIVRALVTGELGGTLRLERGDSVGDRPGTVAEVSVPRAVVEAAAEHLDPDASRPPSEGGRA